MIVKKVFVVVLVDQMVTNSNFMCQPFAIKSTSWWDSLTTAEFHIAIVSRMILHWIYDRNSFCFISRSTFVRCLTKEIELICPSLALRLVNWTKSIKCHKNRLAKVFLMEIQCLFDLCFGNNLSYLLSIWQNNRMATVKRFTCIIIQNAISLLLQKSLILIFHEQHKSV